MRNLALAIALVPVLLLACFGTSAAGEKYKEHTIRGDGYDTHAVERLLDDSEVPGEVKTYANGIEEVKGEFKLDKSKPVVDAALDFIERHRDAFKLKEPKKELNFDGSYGHRTGGSTLIFLQMFKGIPIWSSSMEFDLNEDNDLTEIRGSYVPTPDIDNKPLVTEEEAVAIAKNDPEIYSGYKIWQPDVKLVIYRSTLSYEIMFPEWEYFVDAKKGSIIHKRSTIYMD